MDKHKLIRLLFIIVIQIIITCSLSHAGIIKGKITDIETGEPVPLATIRIEGTGQSMLVNENGDYRIRLDPGFYNIKFSHVAYYSQTLPVSVSGETVELNLELKSSIIELPGTTVYPALLSILVLMNRPR